MSVQRTGRGKVYLVGAGPGAADLVTLRAVRVLGKADVVLVDDLVPRALLAHCPAHATILPVGKRAGCRSTPQAFIQRLMLRYAREGSIVVRLKGGDPFVFGRGGEECAFLRRHGIDAEVVPGITAGIAVPAAVGIPVTHRGMARAVTLVTGHGADGEEPDWDALVRSRATLVVYMGMRRLAHVVARLLAAGLAPETPVAVIAQGTLPDQRAVRATAATIVDAIARAELPAPALIVVGDVVALGAEAVSSFAAGAAEPLGQAVQSEPRMEAIRS